MAFARERMKFIPDLFEYRVIGNGDLAFLVGEVVARVDIHGINLFKPCLKNVIVQMLQIRRRCDF